MKKIRCLCVGGLLCLLAASVFFIYPKNYTSHETKSSRNTHFDYGEYLVTRVIDGDTFDVRDAFGQSARVRLIGIDTPETVDPRKPVQCFGKMASAKMHELVEGKMVRLEKDATGDTKDKYNRLLRHAYLGSLHINAEMIKTGYAFAYTYFPFTFLDDFRQYQKEAERDKLGLWNEANCPTDFTGSHLL